MAPILFYIEQVNQTPAMTKKNNSPQQITLMKPTITIELDVDQASYLHTMINENYFCGSEPLDDFEIYGRQLGIDIKKKLHNFVQENY